MPAHAPKANGKAEKKPRPKAKSAPVHLPRPPEDDAPIPVLARDQLGDYAEVWLNTPNVHLEAKTPLEAVVAGGPWEQTARDILLAYKYGIFG